MGCISPKPKDKEEIPEKVKCREIIRRESQKPWNRASAQVYCGEPKKGTPDEDKPPGEPEKPEDAGFSDLKEASNDAKQRREIVSENSNKYSAQECNSVTGNESNGDVDVKLGNSLPVQKAEEEKMPPAPRTNEHFTENDIVLKMSPPPIIAPFDSGARIIKRPWSLDAVENYCNKPVQKSRPLSYSPGLRMKTKHPKCLHSIEEIPKFRERPKSIDFSVFFQDRDSDKNIQKLKRLLTQKSPRKSKPQTDHCVLDRLILQVRKSQNSEGRKV